MGRSGTDNFEQKKKSVEGSEMEEKELLEIIEKAARDCWTELDLSDKGIKSLPAEIGNLKNLTTLRLNRNQLRSLPVEIGNLKSLTTLDLSYNKLKSLTSKIRNLKNMEMLLLSSNQLSSMPPEIGNMINLNTLWLNVNRLSSLPAEIGKLKNLMMLDLAENKLNDISALMRIKKLGRLDLRKNRISKLPRQIVEMGMEIKWERKTLDMGIFLEGNPLERPPIEIVKQGMEAIQQYFRSLEKETQTLNEVKVLLVGDGGVGKTSLLRRLIEKRFDRNEPQTQGINIQDWKIEEAEKEITIHFWDFGGQEIMHATHQFFLSKRSLYILVLDSRKEENTEYWLKYIESFGGNSPILVVLNKMDENPGFDLNRRFLQEKYKGIKGFYRVSCADKSGIQTFSESLKTELAKVEILETTWPKSWLTVKTKLENMTNEFISYNEYREICERENITQKAVQETLVDFLNDLGLILHFKDFALLDTYVLEPEWITKAVYKIINSEKLAQNKGILKLSSVDEILEKKTKKDFSYPRKKYPYIIEMMKKFELFYEIDSQTGLIPDLLEVQEPEFDFDYGNCLRFIIEYDFLPRSVMPRFIVKMNKEIKGQLRWRTGVVLENSALGATALIRADKRDRKIYIWVAGKQPRGYLATIRKTMSDINDTFIKLNVEEVVPLPDNPEIKIAYEEMVACEQMGRESIFVGKLGKEYRIKTLLDTIEPEETRQNIALVDRRTHEDRFAQVDSIVEVEPLLNIETGSRLENTEGYADQKKYLRQVIKMPEKLRTAFKQYLTYFNDFVKKYKGVDINIEVHSNKEGLELLLENDEGNQLINVNKYLSEYMGFIKGNISNQAVFSNPDISPSEIGHVISDLENQVEHFKNSLKTKDLEVKYLKDNVKYLQYQIRQFHQAIQTRFENPPLVEMKLSQNLTQSQNNIQYIDDSGSEVSQAKTQKEEQEKWYKTWKLIWAIIAGIFLILGGIWTAIQIYEHFHNSESKPKTEQKQNKNKAVENEINEINTT